MRFFFCCCSSLDSSPELSFSKFLFRDARQSPVAFYRVVSSSVLDYEIQGLEKSFSDFREFLFLQVAPCLLDGPGEGIVLFDIAAVKCFYLELHGHPCTKVKNVCLR